MTCSRRAMASKSKSVVSMKRELGLKLISVPVPKLLSAWALMALTSSLCPTSAITSPLAGSRIWTGVTGRPPSWRWK